MGNAQLAVLTAENDLRVANASRTRVAGSAPTVTASPDDTLDTPLSLPTEAELAALAGDGPAVRLATFNVAVARAAKRSQKSTYLPTLTRSYNYAFSQNAGGFVGRNLLLVGGDNASRQTMNFNIAISCSTVLRVNHRRCRRMSRSRMPKRSCVMSSWRPVRI